MTSPPADVRPDPAVAHRSGPGGGAGVGLRAPVRTGLAVALAAGLALGGGRALSAPAAQPTSRAGLVVLLAGGEVRTFCIAFAEPSISGEALLRRSGFDVAADVGMLGTTICRIDRTGCDYPSESCLCRCRTLGAGCTYWAYHTLDGDRWTYSLLGAAARVVRDGDVDGWAWGAGSVVAGAEPPVRTFDQLCRVAEAAPTPPPSGEPTSSGAAAHDPTAAPPVARARPPDGGGNVARSATAAGTDSAATRSAASGDGIAGIPAAGGTDPGLGRATVDAAHSGGDDAVGAPVAPRGDAPAAASPAAGSSSGTPAPDGDAPAPRLGGRSGGSPAEADAGADRPGGAGPGGPGGRTAPADRLALFVYAALVIALAGAAVWLRRAG